MHIFIKGESEDFVLQMMQELNCSGNDYVESLITAVRESEFTRTFTVRMVNKKNPNIVVEKKIKMDRRHAKDGYDPKNY